MFIGLAGANLVWGCYLWSLMYMTKLAPANSTNIDASLIGNLAPLLKLTASLIAIKPYFKIWFPSNLTSTGGRTVEHFNIRWVTVCKYISTSLTKPSSVLQMDNKVRENKTYSSSSSTLSSKYLDLSLDWFPAKNETGNLEFKVWMFTWVTWVTSNIVNYFWLG